MRWGILLLLGLLAWTGPALADDSEKLSIEGALRLRVETIDNQARIATPTDETLISLRTIIQARYHNGPVTIGGDLYDSRVIAPANPSAASTAEVNALEPVQLFAAIDLGDPYANKPYGHLTLGRLATDLGSRRLIANDDYRNTTNGFTGARIDLGGLAGWTGTGFYLLPQERLPEDAQGIRTAKVELDHEGFDTRIWGATMARALPGRLAIDFGGYRFEERDRSDHTTRDRRLTTLTTRLSAPAAPGHWDTEIELMYQTGSIAASLAPGAATLPVRAWLGHAELGYQWTGDWQPHLVMESDYASGDKGDGTYRRFDSLYGMRRGDYAPSGLYSSISRSNLVAIGPRLEVTPSEQTDGFITVKKLLLASATDSFSGTGVIDPSGKSGRDAGWQTDACLRLWVLPKRFRLEVDGVWLAKGSFLRDAPNHVSDRDTFYLSLNATVFFRLSRPTGNRDIARATRS
jgi:hypothetical protein